MADEKPITRDPMIQALLDNLWQWQDVVREERENYLREEEMAERVWGKVVAEVFGPLRPRRQ